MKIYREFNETPVDSDTLHPQGLTVFNAALQRGTGLPDRFVGENDLIWQFTNLTNLGEKTG